MVNRILNKDSAHRERWLEILEEAERMPAASPETTRDAREFLGFQRLRNTEYPRTDPS